MFQHLEQVAHNGPDVIYNHNDKRSHITNGFSHKNMFIDNTRKSCGRS